MSRPRATLLALLLATALAAAGCGGGDEPEGAAGTTAPVTTAETTTAEATTAVEEPEDEAAPEEDAAALARRPEGEEGLRVAAEKAQLVAGESDFGRVLFDANGQVVYVFEIDRPDESNCTSAECVKAWPPVLTEQEPSAGEGVDAELLGTIRRSDGTLQVTYDGRPLYFYEHEGPDEIRCHNVDLHGGLWWVVRPDGEPAA